MDALSRRDDKVTRLMEAFYVCISAAFSMSGLNGIGIGDGYYECDVHACITIPTPHLKTYASVLACLVDLLSIE